MTNGTFCIEVHLLGEASEKQVLVEPIMKNEIYRLTIPKIGSIVLKKEKENHWSQIKGTHLDSNSLHGILEKIEIRN